MTEAERAAASKAIRRIQLQRADEQCAAALTSKDPDRDEPRIYPAAQVKLAARRETTGEGPPLDRHTGKCIAIRFSPETYARILRLAADRGVSMAEIARWAVLHGLPTVEDPP